MELKLYKKMVQRCAMLPTGIQGIAKMVPSELQIEYDGIRWYPYQCVFYCDGNGCARYTAVLHSLTANSVVTVELDEIDVDREDLGEK